MDRLEQPPEVPVELVLAAGREVRRDQHAFLPGWKWKSDEQWEAITEELLAGETWVMDGAFAMEKAVKRADTILFLDFSRARGYLGSARAGRLALQALARAATSRSPGCRDRDAPHCASARRAFRSSGSLTITRLPSGSCRQSSRGRS